ncbi:MAG TPA: response regulator [Flavitalea sp.]|nr:response regulator [Flavitalea sp.]
MNKSILSVNGNKAMNFLLQTILEREYKFVPVNDVFQAMHQLRSQKKVSALVVDLDFQPNQSWELIEHIKSSKLFRIPVIVLTTDNTETLRQKCYEFEVDEIFFKPFNPEDLIAAIRSMMNVAVVNNLS